MGRMQLRKSEVVKLLNIMSTSHILPIHNKLLSELVECMWKIQGPMYQNGEVKWNEFRTYAVAMFLKYGVSTLHANLLASNVITKCGNIRHKYPGKTIILLLNCLTRFVDNNLEKIGQLAEKDKKVFKASKYVGGLRNK